MFGRARHRGSDGGEGSAGKCSGVLDRENKISRHVDGRIWTIGKKRLLERAYKLKAKKIDYMGINK